MNKSSMRMDYKIENALFFLIGVSEYVVREEETSLQGRPFVEKGLSALVEALKLTTNNKDGENIILISNPKNGLQVTERIRNEVNEKQNSGTKIRFIFFYYCGHGMLHEGKAHYMTTAECTHENYEDKGRCVNLGEVYKLFSRYAVTQGAKILTVIDSCYSGAVRGIDYSWDNLCFWASCKGNEKSKKDGLSRKLIEILLEGIEDSNEGYLTIQSVQEELNSRITGQSIHPISVGNDINSYKFAVNRSSRKNEKSNTFLEGYKPINRKEQHGLFQRLHESKKKVPKTTLIIGPYEELANELIDRFIHYYFCDKLYFDNRKTYDNPEGLMPKGLSYNGVVDLESFNLCTRELAYSFGIADRDGEITAAKLLRSKPHEVILCTIAISLRNTGFQEYSKLKKFISWYCNQFWPTHLDQPTSPSIYLFVNIITPHYTEGYGRVVLNWYLSKGIKGDNTEVLFLEKVLRQDIKDYLFDQKFDTNGVEFSSVLKKIEGYEMKMNMVKAQNKLKSLLKELQKSAQ